MGAWQGARRVGRYLVHRELAAGGMASVHLGRLIGPAGFARTVAIKRLHERYAKDPQFVAMFLDEARIAARIRHPNVVSTLDVVAQEGELFLVMDFVYGESLSRLVGGARDREAPIDLGVVVGVASGFLAGLHAAHEATSEDRMPLDVIHRDVSPQNVLVGTDGVPRVVDFGIAKAAGRSQSTRDGQVKGKLAYMAPEQIRSEEVNRRVDVYASAVVVWEMLTQRKLHSGDEAQVIYSVLHNTARPPSELRPDVPPELEAVVMRGLSQDPEARFATAMEMAEALEKAHRPASAREIAAWVESVSGPALRERAAQVEEVERSDADAAPPITARGAGQDDAAPTRRQSQSGDTGPGTTAPDAIERTRDDAVPAAAERTVTDATSDVGPQGQRHPRAPASRSAVALFAALAALAVIAFVGWRAIRPPPVPPVGGASAPARSVDASPALPASEPPSASLPASASPSPSTASAAGAPSAPASAATIPSAPSAGSPAARPGVRPPPPAGTPTAGAPAPVPSSRRSQYGF